MKQYHKLEGVTHRLRNAVLASGKTPKQIQAETGIPHSTYYNHVNGGAMSEVFIAKYCKALGISADWLLGLKGAER